MKGNALLLLKILIIGFLFTNCKKEDQKNLYVNENVLEFDYNEDSKTVTVNCVGDKDFSWEASSDSEFFEFSKTSGWCSKNNADQFELILLRQNIHQDSTTASVEITASTGEIGEIPILLKAYPEKKIRYNKSIKHVEYDYENDRLIILSDELNQSIIDIYDLESNTFQQVDLPNFSSYFSLSNDYSYILASYYYTGGPFASINLGTLELEDEYYINDDYNYFVTSSDKMVYLFHYYYDIATYNLSTQSYNEYDFPNSMDIDYALIHPSEKYLYGMYSSRLVKFNIENPEPVFIYSEYVNPFFNTFFMSKDGTLIFTPNKAILHIDPELPSIDITETEQLNIPNDVIKCFDQNIERGEFLFTTSHSNSPYSYGNKVYIYDEEFQNKELIIAEDFYFTNGYLGQEYETYDAEIRYLFVNREGDKIIIVSKPSEYYINYWGIEIIER